ncbi:MAG: hypothetical protein KAH21_01970, partial [Spirochaetaceae bacterium]|nr:hypothetical protein [Spirochaetaceae bacterium]
MVLRIPLYAGGGSDDDFDPKSDLESAAALIEDGRLDDAIQVLVEIARKDPEQMERVQKIILSVREREAEIKENFTKIREVIQRDDLSPNEKLLLIEEQINNIKKIDSDPTSDTWMNLSFVESELRLSLDVLRREEYFDRGNEKLALNRYQEAVDIYHSGFIDSVFGESQTYEKYRDAETPSDIEKYEVNPKRQKTIFDAYRAIAPEGDQTIDEIGSLLSLWKQQSTQIAELESIAAGVVSTSVPENWVRSLADYIDTLDIVGDEIQSTLILSNKIKALKKQLYDNLEGAPEDFRYDRIESFLFGREGNEAEGIIYSQSIQWEDSYMDILFRMLERVRQPYADGLINKSSSSFTSSGFTAEKTLEIVSNSDTYASLQREAGITRFVNR